MSGCRDRTLGDHDLVAPENVISNSELNLVAGLHGLHFQLVDQRKRYPCPVLQRWFTDIDGDLVLRNGSWNLWISLSAMEINETRAIRVNK